MLYSLYKVTKIYENKPVLDIDNLLIEPGKIYALLGPNGAGKTTLLNILAFLESPDSGEISYRGSPVKFTENRMHKLRKKVVLLDQYPILFSTTVFKNLEFGLKIRKIHRKVRENIISESLELVGMLDFIHSPAHKLSGGETQRVALARALALSPDVLLCDEPTSSVDIENQAVIMNILKQVNEEKKISLFFTSHKRLEAAALADHTLFMDHGKIVSAHYENFFNAELIPINGSKSRCVINDLIHFELPVQKSGNVRLRFDPEKIDISHFKENDRKDFIPGKIVQIMQERNKIRIAVNGGIYINLLLSEDKYREKKLFIGDSVMIDFPFESIQIL